MNKKIDIVDLIDARLGDNFKVGDKLLDICRNAKSIGNMAQKQVDDDGEFAKVYAESIAGWMEELTTLANEAVTLLVNNSLAENEAEQEKALNNIA